MIAGKRREATEEGRAIMEALRRVAREIYEAEQRASALECEYISQRDKRWIANARQPDKRLRKPRSEREKELRAEIKAARQRVSRLRQNEVDIMMGRIPRRLREPSGAPEIP